jgi:hypothetical protein
MSGLKWGLPGHVYVVAFSNGVVKVGGSNHVKQRLSSVRSLGRKLGGEPIVSFYFAHQYVAIGESISRKFALESGGSALPGFREWLTGVDLRDLIGRLVTFWPDVALDIRSSLWMNTNLRGAYIFNRSDIAALLSPSPEREAAS